MHVGLSDSLEATTRRLFRALGLGFRVSGAPVQDTEVCPRQAQAEGFSRLYQYIATYYNFTV